MLRIFLARHGQNIDNANGILNGHRDLALTEKGREQAYQLANKISEKDINFTKIYCSPLVRAKETAEIVAKKLGKEDPEILVELIERDFGKMTGIEASRIEELCYPDILKTDTITYFLNPEGAETFEQLLLRGKKVLSFVKSTFSDGNILLVGHGDMGKMIIAAYHNISWEKILKQFHFGNSELIELSPEIDIKDIHRIPIQQYNN